MKIIFTAKTNKDYAMVNTAKFMFHGVEMIIDRDETSYSIEDGNLTMVWSECYLWGIGNYTPFENIAYLDGDETGFAKSLVFVDLELEDDADPDYEVTDVKCTICY